MAPNQQRGGIWDASECALLLIDYQDSVLDLVFEEDRRVVELNARTIATFARDIHIPVVLSTVGVEMGVNEPTIPSLVAALPDVEPVDRSQMNAWEDAGFVEAVKATGRNRLVMGGIVTSTCLALTAASALDNGYEVTFIEDAVADASREIHDTAVLRLAHAGAVPNTTIAMTAEWFRDWKSPLADVATELWVPYKAEWAALKRAPELIEPKRPPLPPVMHEIHVSVVSSELASLGVAEFWSGGRLIGFTHIEDGDLLLQIEPSLDGSAVVVGAPALAEALTEANRLLAEAEGTR